MASVSPRIRGIRIGPLEAGSGVGGRKVPDQSIGDRVGEFRIVDMQVQLHQGDPGTDVLA